MDLAKCLWLWTQLCCSLPCRAEFAKQVLMFCNCQMLWIKIFFCDQMFSVIYFFFISSGVHIPPSNVPQRFNENSNEKYGRQKRQGKKKIRAKQWYPNLDEDRCNKKAYTSFKFIFQVWVSFDLPPFVKMIYFALWIPDTWYQEKSNKDHWERFSMSWFPSYCNHSFCCVRLSSSICFWHWINDVKSVFMGYCGILDG